MFIPYPYDIILFGYLITFPNRHDNSVFSMEFFWNFSKALKNRVFWSSEDCSNVSRKCSILHFLYSYTEKFLIFWENSGIFLEL